MGGGGVCVEGWSVSVESVWGGGVCVGVVECVRGVVECVWRGGVCVWGGV